MYHQRRAVERIVAAEIMKLERRQAMERARSNATASTGSSAHPAAKGRRPSLHPPR
jgi:hypothetical protein